MKNDTKRVLILNKFSSPEIQQAIVILKNPNPRNETEIVREAERVIDEYLHKRRCTAPAPDRTGGRILAAVVALGIVISALAVDGGVHLLASIF